VSVGKGDWVAMAGWVEEGSELMVQVEVVIGKGSGWVMDVNAPHPIKNKVVAEIEIKNFRKLLKRMIDIPQNAQAIKREPGGNDLNDIGFLRDDLRKTACGNHLRFRTQFLAKAFDHALDHAHITV